ncbi:saccharopine dehydrogenase family protein [Coralloluteibacterium stylophorae]|uniref:Saccharopine dehydrogenase NADP-binding domain-containing protein n=1 Tax=Coralloluteibacterium stylophorae TaxID=1776034 RepID=A0A8J7VTK4_9GAMM|nr:saccharopine dehydrogenase NADP-binding domain-containing protein [Coralloluteibacterium stylophorae]MBS7457051.1 saccharopine dehydrogenase NADP-binding domain-containing protein [Coralloluteibacterium stylophorae]
MDWMIYGANGYAGRLVAAQAVRRGLRPVLAGRGDAVRTMARTLSQRDRVFALDDAPGMAHALDGIGLVLNCAGPFARTCPPLLRACLERGVHYLDLSGEIDVFAHCHALDAEARARGVVVLPGVGFDVTATDGVGARLHRAVPAATSLVLAFETRGRPSPGTVGTLIEGLAAGGRVRRAGALCEVPLAATLREFACPPQAQGEPERRRCAISVPWGDLYTAGVSTGIPDVEVFMATPPRRARWIRRLRPLAVLARVPALRRMLHRHLLARLRGPDAEARRRHGAMVWGEIRDAGGNAASLRLRLPNAYDFTVEAALAAVGRLRCGLAHGTGFHTPTTLFGVDFVFGLPGVEAV